MEHNDFYFLTLKHIRVFLAAAKYSNFTRAAEELYLTQASVSRTIGQMEQALEFPLFKRARYGVELTDQGRILAKEWKWALELMENSRRRAKKLDDDSNQKLLIGDFATTRNEIYLLPIIRDFESRHANAHVEILELSPQQTLDMLIGGRLDAAFFSRPYEKLLERNFLNLAVFDVITIPPCFVIARGNPLFTQEHLDAAALAKQTLVAMCEPFVERWTFVEQVYHECGFEIPDVIFVDNPQTMAFELQRRACVALMDEAYVPLDRSDLRYVRLEASIQQSGFVLAAQIKSGTALLHDFVESVRRFSKSQTYVI